MQKITQAQLKSLKKLTSRHNRQKEQEIIVEGLRCIESILQNSHELIKHIFVTEDFTFSKDYTRIHNAISGKNIEISEIKKSELSQICETETPQGVMALAKYPQNRFDHNLPPCDPIVLVLDRIQDPGNIGTIIRTALAAGLTELWLVNGCTDPYSPKTIRSAMGGQFLLKLNWVKSLEQLSDYLKNHDYNTMWLTGPRAEISIFSDNFEINKSAIVIGNEANGIDPNTSVGQWVSIPMPGKVESLNAAQAATIVLFDAVRKGILK